MRRFLEIVFPWLVIHNLKLELQCEEAVLLDQEREMQLLKQDLQSAKAQQAMLTSAVQDRDRLAAEQRKLREVLKELDERALDLAMEARLPLVDLAIWQLRGKQFPLLAAVQQVQWTETPLGKETDASATAK